MRDLEFLPDWYPKLRRRKRTVALQAWGTLTVAATGFAATGFAGAGVAVFFACVWEGAPLATFSRTVDAFGAFVPEVGFWATTVPACWVEATPSKRLSVSFAPRVSA